MSKQITIGGIVTVMILLIALNQLPSGDVTDSKSAIKNAQYGLTTDAVIDAGGQAIEHTSELAVESACKDGYSQGCSTTTKSVNIIGIAFTLMVFGIIVDGLVGFSKWIIRTAEFVSDLLH